MNPSITFANRFTIHAPVQDLLGRGGKGDVYRATDAQTSETVTVKVLSPETLAREPGLLERFVREGQALRQLNHPKLAPTTWAQQGLGSFAYSASTIKPIGKSQETGPRHWLPTLRSICHRRSSWLPEIAGAPAIWTHL